MKINNLKWILKVRSLKKKLGVENITIKKGIDIAKINRVKINEFVYIGDNFKVWGEGTLQIKSNVIIGPNVTIMTSSHNYNENIEFIPYDSKNICKETIIEENVWIGANVSIIPGVTIGEGSVIGLGSVVTKSIPPLSVVGGNPAKIIKIRDLEKYEELKSKQRFYLVEKVKR